MCVGVGGGNGTLLMTGGVLNVVWGLQIGSSAGSIGLATINGGTVNAVSLDVGVGCSGEMDIGPGGTVNYGWWYGLIGVGAGGVGTVNTSGTVNSWHPDYWSPLVLGWAGGTGIWNQNGGITTAASDFCVGDGVGGAGTLSLNGGVFATNAVLGAITAGGSTGKIIFNGGTMRALMDNGNFFNDNTGALTLMVTSAGGTFDTNGFDVGVVQPLGDGITGGGTFAKAGNGNLTLAATNTFTGTMAVAGGQPLQRRERVQRRRTDLRYRSRKSWRRSCRRPRRG